VGLIGGICFGTGVGWIFVRHDIPFGLPFAIIGFNFLLALLVYRVGARRKRASINREKS
jgi:hypothetical protein